MQPHILQLDRFTRDPHNKLTRAAVIQLSRAITIADGAVILTGNPHCFSAGADLEEIHALTGPAALEFAKMGQELMNSIAHHPAPTVAAISGYCMGGGLDLALACGLRIAAPNSIFGHRGAALGLMTGWGGTQRLPRLIGRGRALQMFLAAEKIHAPDALRMGLIDQIADDPLQAALDLTS